MALDDTCERLSLFPSRLGWWQRGMRGHKDNCEMEGRVDHGIEPKHFADAPALRSLLASLGAVFDGVVLLDGHFRILFMNEPATVALGLGLAADRIGCSFEELSHPMGLSSFTARVLERDGAAIEDEVVVEKAGAEPHLLTLRFCHDIGPGLHLLVVRDVSDRGRRERGERIYTALAQVLLEASSLSEALPKLLEALARPLGFQGADLFRTDPGSRLLKWEGGWHGVSELRAVGEACRRDAFEYGVGLPGEAWARSEPLWVEAVGDRPGIRHREALERSGVESVLAFPVRSVGEIVGIFVFFSQERRDRDESILRLLSAFDPLIGQCLERLRLLEAERLLKERAEAGRQRFQAILMNAPIPVVVYEGPAHVITMANPAWIEMIASLGGETDVIGKPLREAFAASIPEQAEHVARELDQVYRTREAVRLSEFPLPVTRPDGSVETRYFAASGQPLQGPGVDLIVQMAVDITEQVAARRQKEAAYEEAEAEMRAKDEFLAVLSHELRTPLQSMLGWTQLLLSRPFDPKLVRRGIETIERNTKQQAKLIEQLLEVSRVIAGKVHLDRHPLALETVVDASLDSLRAEASRKGVEIDVRGEVDGEVYGDADRLRQVVTNLLGNAIKFTPQGGRVTITLGRRRDKAYISVADTGRGIPPRLIERIFDPFRQADAWSRRTHGGLGLGLSIVKHLVEQHGGTVHAESPGEGRGATFTIELPILSPSERGRALPVPEEGGERPISLFNARILLVDDDVDGSEVTAMALRDAGAEVHLAHSAREAVERFRELRPDLLISDIAMPDEDGYSLLRKVREIDASFGGRTPAIALTAYAGGSNRLDALRAGFDIHMPKPVTPSALARIAAVLLEAGRPDAEVEPTPS